MTWVGAMIGGSGCGLSAAAVEAVMAKHAIALTTEHASLLRFFLANIVLPPSR
jgi:hypothetical protein